MRPLFSFKDGILQRVMEDIYNRFTKTEDKIATSASDLHDRMNTLDQSAAEAGRRIGEK